jgi:hypothetical protein
LQLFALVYAKFRQVLSSHFSQYAVLPVVNPLSPGLLNNHLTSAHLYSPVAYTRKRYRKSTVRE